MNENSVYDKKKARRDRFRKLIRTMFQRKIVIVAGIGVLLFIFIAVFAGVLTPFDPNQTNPYESFQKPNSVHLLGTDDYGRDILTRLFFGARVSLIVGVLAVAIACVIGVLLGLFAAYFGGWVDALIMRCSEALMSIPRIMVALALIAHYRTIDALYSEIRAAGEEGAKQLATYFKTELGITKNPLPALCREEQDTPAGEAAARLSLALATIKRDIPIGESLSDLAVRIDYGEWKRVLDELEIRTIPLPEADQTERKAFALRDMGDDVEAVLAAVAADAAPVALRKSTRECSAEDWQSVFGLSKREYIVAIAQSGVRYLLRIPEENGETVCRRIAEGLLGHVIYCVDAKREWCGFFSRESLLYDLSVMDYLLRPLQAEHGIAQILGEWEGEAPEDTEQYAEAMLRVGELLREKLREQGMEKLYTEIEMPLMWVLSEMEDAGVLVDPDQLGAFAAYLRGEIERETRAIYAASGHEFNINSTKQLAEVLFTELAIPYPDKKKKSYSTSADILEKLRGQHPIVDAVLRYRQYAKLLSTYAEGLYSYIADDGRIHTTFTQTVTATGRLSSIDPNLQNIPTRTELGRDIRKAFVPKPGCRFVDADYSQIELRLMAHLSGDANLQRAYHSAADIHRLTASQVLGIPYEEVTSEQRSAAKAVNFGILYGISSFSLAQDLGVTRSEADAYIRDYFERFPGVRTYLDNTIASAKKDGWVRTLYGRVRPVPELSSQEFRKRMFGERVAMNSPIQGTAADIMKLAMIAVDRRLRDGGFAAKVLLQVHDELLLEVPAEEVSAVSELVKQAMESVAELAVPLECEVHVGDNWLDAKG